MKLLVLAAFCLFIISLAEAGSSRLKNRSWKKYNSDTRTWHKRVQQCGYEVKKILCILMFLCIMKHHSFMPLCKTSPKECI